MAKRKFTFDDITIYIHEKIEEQEWGKIKEIVKKEASYGTDINESLILINNALGDLELILEYNKMKEWIILPQNIHKKKETRRKYIEKKWDKGEFLRPYDAFNVTTSDVNYSMVARGVDPDFSHTIKFLEKVKGHKCYKCEKEVEYRFNMLTNGKKNYSKYVCRECMVDNMMFTMVNIIEGVSGKKRIKSIISRSIDKVYAERIANKLAE